jgi:hypothetical protein
MQEPVGNATRYWREERVMVLKGERKAVDEERVA